MVSILPTHVYLISTASTSLDYRFSHRLCEGPLEETAKLEDQSKGHLIKGDCRSGEVQWGGTVSIPGKTEDCPSGGHGKCHPSMVPVSSLPTLCPALLSQF